MKNKNTLLIINWLGWKILTSESCQSFQYIENEHYCGGIEFLNFESDAEFLWLCLEKIAEELQITIEQVWLFHLSRKLSPNTRINSKQDLYNAIINYIKKKENEKSKIKNKLF